MKEPIFIVGVARSGTSLLTSMLNSHPNIAIPAESWYIPSLADYVSKNRQKKKNVLSDEIINLIETHPLTNYIPPNNELMNELQRMNFEDVGEIVSAGHLAFMKNENK